MEEAYYRNTGSHRHAEGGVTGSRQALQGGCRTRFARDESTATAGTEAQPLPGLEHSPSLLGAYLYEPRPSSEVGRVCSS